MNSFRAAALRLIFPLLVRVATVDFLGAGEIVDFFDDDFEEDVLFGLDEMLLVDVERLDEEERLEEECPFCADNSTGTKRNAAKSAMAIRLNIVNPPVENDNLLGLSGDKNQKAR